MMLTRPKLLPNVAKLSNMANVRYFSFNTRRSLSTTHIGNSTSIEPTLPKREIAKDESGKNSCPFGFSSGSSSSPSTAPKHHPPLSKVKLLPYIGSMLPQYSGTPKFIPEKIYDYHVEMRRRFGEFYNTGLPFLGRGRDGLVYNLIDPNEMIKVVRGEGAYPSGIVENLRLFKRVLRKGNYALFEGEDYGLLDKGERWKRQRTFLQTGMLDPRTAKGFIPGIVTAAELASKGAPASSSDLNMFLNHCAFDMFNTFMFGELTRTADPTTQGLAENEENIKFCKAAITMVENSSKVSTRMYEIFMFQMNFRTALTREFEESWGIVREIGMRKVQSFITRREKGLLNERERASYFANALDRYEAGKTEISREEMIELCIFALFVSVDTTSSVTAWNLMHLALNPRVQEILHAELTSTTAEYGTEGRHLNARVLEKSTTPYLSAVLRETQRLTPPFPFALIKSNSYNNVEIHGKTFPIGSIFQLNDIGYDPNYVEDAKEFRPERWSDEGVQSRKGTKLEIMDHALMRDPFGQGARRCPGSRIATNEVLAMISQLVLDYRISCPPGVQSLDDIKVDAMGIIAPHMPPLQFELREK